MEALEAVWGLTLVFFGWCLWALAFVGGLIIVFAFLVGIGRATSKLIVRKGKKRH